MIGNYISYEDANSAISNGGYQDCAVSSGNSYTVAVVKTGTNQMLFEFDYAEANYLVVMPVSSDGTKCQTWFKGYRYYGGFQYPRYDGGDLTVYNVVDLEDYVKGVLPYEMNNTWPLEALKAQAVCARSYVLAAKRHSGFDVCTTEDCQVYRGVSQSNATTDAAVEQTAGQYLTYNDQLCIAYFSSCDGGATENSENVWKDNVPYLRGVADPYEADVAANVPGYSWTVTYTADQITTRLRNKNYNVGQIVSMTVSKYTDAGNVYTVSMVDSNGVTWKFSKGDVIRSVLGVSSIRFAINGGDSTDDVYVNGGTSSISGGLQSSYAVGGDGIAGLLGQSKVYAITGTGDVAAVGEDSSGTATSGVFTIKGTGKGHNVGMSQWGAYSMAKYHNMTFDQILKFYFTGVAIG
jgi:stage II sporulation protein D